MLLRAKFLMPDSSTLIENGSLRISGTTISEVGEFSELRKNSEKIIELGNSVIMPGLVNTHTHLELTNHKVDRPHRNDQFTDWLLQIINHRKLNKLQIERAIADGLEMCIASGTTSIGQIQTSEHGLELLQNSPIGKVIFIEQTTNRRPQIINRNFGISPHAPYSTSPEVYRQAVKLAQRDGLKFCTHLAETKPELEFLRSGTGEFSELLKTLKISQENYSPPRSTPVEFMEKLGVLELSPLLVHCNYLSDSDIELIAGSQASTAFCPRSHYYFHHENHPINRLLKSSINVGIGTDSLASNWSLSMLDELKFLRKNYANLSSRTLFDLATINGAKALKLDRVGKLRKGWQADLIAMKIPENQKSPLHWLFDDSSENLLTVVAGSIRFTNRKYFANSL